MSNESHASILEHLRGCAEVMVLSHPSPDGDSLGSSAGLAHILAGIGIQSIITVPDHMPEKYEFLFSDLHWVQGPVNVQDQQVIVLDCSDLKRLRQSGQELDGARHVINIDHHHENEHFGHLNYVCTEAAATGQLIFELFANQVQITPPAATALFTALFTDTGRFSYTNTDARCFQTALSLVKLGARPGDIYSRVFQNKSPEFYKFLSVALSKITLEQAGKLAVLVLTNEELSQYSIQPWEYEELVDYPRSIAGVMVAALVREEDRGIRISLRSKADFDVGQIARRLGGGGHKNAAGVILPPPLTDALTKFRHELHRSEVK